MIGTLLRLSWLNLKRDRVAQSLSFVLPIAFFSIFASVFGGQDEATTAAMKVAVVDEDQSDASKRLVEAIEGEGSFKVVQLKDKDRPAAWDRPRAERSVASGEIPVAIVLPKGIGAAVGSFSGDGPAVQLLVDKSNPMAAQMTAGLLQKVAMTAAPDLMIQRGLEQFEKYAGDMTDAQKSAMERFLPMLRGLATEGAGQSAGSQPSKKAETSGRTAGASKSGGERSRSAQFGSPLRVETVDLLGQNDKTPEIAFYAAGTAVMFLLFMTSGAGGALLEEEENGTIERLLSSKLTMTRLLVGKWLFIATMGTIQVSIMFIWGAMVFGLKLWTPNHLAGFAVMTLVTAAAAAAFGLVLATLCRSRAQLGGVATIVILIMSAVGGSMFPRFMMSATMQKVGLATFNAWALDGYQKVFWYDQPVVRLWPQVAMLAGLTVVFLAAARMLARRWEAV